MWYLLPIDRLRHLFSNPRDSKLIRWWASDGRKKGDGVLRHPSDAQQWKGFDAKYPESGEDPRNVRFALSTVGMNPFGDRTTTHGTWSILLSIYNLPPWLFMKRKYFLLTMIISRPKALGINIDVFLEPLMQDMEILWKEGVEMWDELAKSAFTLRAIIFVTMTDYPGHFFAYRVDQRIPRMLGMLDFQYWSISRGILEGSVHASPTLLSGRT